MKDYKEHKHLGVYGILIEDNKILLIKKKTGPYDGKLDLPGGTIEFKERPTETLKRELLEETGLKVKKYKYYDADSVIVDWNHNNKNIKVHHIGIFYIISKYTNKIKTNIEITSQNDDSLGANFYNINKLTKEQLSAITILELKKLGYKIK